MNFDNISRHRAHPETAGVGIGAFGLSGLGLGLGSRFKVCSLGLRFRA